MYSSDCYSSAGMDVHLFVKPTPGRTTAFLTCHVTGSDLSGTRIQITKDGDPLVHRVKLAGPLPNGDGTFQIRFQAQLSLKTTQGYRCLVQRGSDTLSVRWGRSL